MKILIADDEELVRENLKDILRGIAQGGSISEAVNGRILIEKAREIQPDICFVDIRMPGITGLEAIESLTEEFPDISWIILSGYSDFDYARKAINLGVCDYLLKPATEAEVETALTRASEKRLDAGRLRREKFEYRVGGVINNSSAVEFDDFLLGLGRCAAVMFVPLVSESALSVEQQHVLTSGMRDVLDKMPSHDYAGVFTVLEGFPAVISAGNNPELFLENLVDVFPRELTGASEVFKTEVCENLPGLLSYIEDILKPAAEKIVSVAENNPESSSRIVTQAEALIRRRYNEPIGVGQIADELNITPNYLSMLFKKYKNISFTRYITDIRLEKAPELLSTPGITVKEAAYRLGYMSSRHFARLFRERYGISPSDYRK